MRYLLVGNYGVGNAGDEALKEYFLTSFPDVSWKVVSAEPNPHELSRFPGGLRSLLGCRWIRTLRALRDAHGLVFGGGALFTDIESVRACFLWAVPALVAYALRKPFFLAFQGIGPFRTKVGECLARWVIAHASFISVRDQASFDRLMGREVYPERPRPFSLTRTHSARSTAFVTNETRKGGGVEGWKKYTEIVQSFDPAFALIERKKENLRTKNILIFIPRFSTVRLGTAFANAVPRSLQALRLEYILSHLRRWQGEKGAVRIISLHAGHLRERMFSQSLASSLGIPLRYVSSLPELAALLEGGSIVLTERYHGALVALACGIPFLALRICEGDKLDALARLCGCPSETLDSLSAGTIFGTDWERIARGLPRLRTMCEEHVRVGEEALREALQRFLYTVQ